MSSLGLAAVHKAGHAIAAAAVGLEWSFTSIGSDGGTGGRIGVRGDEGFDGVPSSPDYDAQYHACAMQQAILDCAGHATMVVILGIGT